MNARLLLRLPRPITTMLRRRNMKWYRLRLARLMYMFGFLASGNGAVAGCGFTAVGRLARIVAQSGSVAAGFGTDIIASGSAATGAENRLKR